MNKKMKLYRFLKKLENPDYVSSGLPYLLNFMMCFSLSEYGRYVKHTLNKKYPGKFILLLPSRSAGDVFYLKQRFEELLQIAKINNYILVLDDAGCFRAAKSMGYDNVVPVSMVKQKALLIYQRTNFCKNTDISDCYPWCMFDLKSGKNSDKYTAPELYTDTEPQTETARKTVIISPYENSMSVQGYPLLPSDFWVNLARELTKRGYFVYTNCSGNAKEPVIDGTEQIFPEISKIRETVEKAGGCIMMRSGFTDYSSQTSTRKVVLYPVKDCLNIWSVYRTLDVPNCIEIIYENRLDDYSSLIQEICDYIEEGKVENT
ncbi:MAG: hypothetical protein J6A07_09315 [Firmicutes bacterium]|nr:hypothetical protein [Bacillota bacterium]